MTAPTTHRPGGRRGRLMEAIGGAVARFQEGSYLFDDAAAEILAIDRTDLKCMTTLLFNGSASARELQASLHVKAAILSTALERLQLAGYARQQPGGAGRIELTEHARTWIERIWAPLRIGGARLMAGYSTVDLARMDAFLTQASALQEQQTRRLRVWLRVPEPSVRRPHLRGGLSPAALRRVQLFVEANLARPIHLRDLAARAGLSPFHFARAFKLTAGLTPRAFVEERRLAAAKTALEESSRPLADVAAATGFGSQSRFTAVFKRRTGFTPAVYRRGHP